MKKLFIFILCLITLSGCQTQEEIKKQKEQEELNKIKNEVQNSEIPEEVKTWTYDVKTKKLSTVFCISTSKKCADFKTILEELKTEYNIDYYYFEVDKIDDNVKKHYKDYFELKDYTGYLPYTIISNKDKLITTKTDVLKKEELLSLFEEKKLDNVDESIKKDTE